MERGGGGGNGGVFLQLVRGVGCCSAKRIADGKKLFLWISVLECVCGWGGGVGGGGGGVKRARNLIIIPLIN